MFMLDAPPQVAARPTPFFDRIDFQAEGAAESKGPFMARRITKTRCSICRKHGREKFFYMRRRFIFDVDLARKIVSDGRSPMELDRDDLRFAVETCHVNRNHVPHVDPT